MEVKLEKQYPVAADIDSAWKVLSDLPALAGCMPGAQITEKVDDTHYKGQVNVKVGPAAAAFGGVIEMQNVDAPNKTIKMQGKGADRGGSSATMDMTASLKPGASANACVLDGASSVIVNGKFAQFGGRMMGSVSEVILAQFAENFSKAAAALAPAASVAAVPGNATNATNDANVTNAANVASASTSSATVAPSVAPAAPAAPTQLNALSILWMMIKNFFRNLFGKKSAG